MFMEVEVVVGYSENLLLQFSKSLLNKHNSSNDSKFGNLHPITYKNFNLCSKTPSMKTMEIIK